MNVCDIATKILIDDEEEFSFAIKARVENPEDDEEVCLALQGLDTDGFEVYELVLEGTVPPGESKILTTKEEDADRTLYEKIAKWQVKY
ncbi:hypothetical protein [Candidatus Sororendozoicomonas aggregata]|uniref:hypothetical protein n=1 Tax=Candidatus Sororendozoicomonas aggregata TaxID=3073239 RepID=UPI002ED3BE14